MAKITRRNFVKGVAAAGAFVYAGGFLDPRQCLSQTNKSRVFRVDHCPVHDGELRHEGLDTLLDLFAQHGTHLYRTSAIDKWAGPEGLINRDDVVLIKVNRQWKCRGTTTPISFADWFIEVLGHPEGFTGEVVIIENGQGRGGFDGMAGGGTYNAWSEIANNVHINAEEETVLTIDYLVNNVFVGRRVSSFLLDSIRSNSSAAATTLPMDIAGPATSLTHVSHQPAAIGSNSWRAFGRMAPTIGAGSSSSICRF